MSTNFKSNNQYKIKWNASAIFYELVSDNNNELLFPIINRLHFQLNKYLFYYENSFLDAFEIQSNEWSNYIGLQAIRKNKVIVNRDLFSLLLLFNGQNSIETIYKNFSKKIIEIMIIDQGECKKYKTTTNSFSGFLRIIKLLYKNDILKVKSLIINSENSSKELIQNYFNIDEILVRKETQAIVKERICEVPCDNTSKVLLLGDTKGSATIGLLYLASYIKQNGINVSCRLNNFSSKETLEQDIKNSINKLNPTIVGISLKWFLHIARVLEIAKYIKDIDKNIKVVLGGNTASYYWNEIIQNENIDYIILGDGEEPLLKLCKNDTEIPNLVSKQNNAVLNTQISYKQGKNNNNHIFLSDLNDIFISRKDPYLSDYLYVNTGKGCDWNCFYCAGCRETQIVIFNRSNAFVRDINTIRNDIQIFKKINSTLMFDFDIPTQDDVEFYKNIWKGIDLSRYFCIFFFWTVPSDELVDLIHQTFSYSYLYIDLPSFDQEKRMRLEKEGLTKNQPTNEEIIHFCDKCEELENISFGICTIWGTPYFSIKEASSSEEIVSNLYKNYNSFIGVECMKLHAQPGAPILRQLDRFEMYSDANSYQQFYNFSVLNHKLDKEQKDIYPYINFKDSLLQKQVNYSLQDISNKILKSIENKKYLDVMIESNKEEIEKLYNKGIIKGKADNISADSFNSVEDIKQNNMLHGFENDLFFKYIIQKLNGQIL